MTESGESGESSSRVSLEPPISLAPTIMSAVWARVVGSADLVSAEGSPSEGSLKGHPPLYLTNDNISRTILKMSPEVISNQ